MVSAPRKEYAERSGPDLTRSLNWMLIVDRNFEDRNGYGGKLGHLLSSIQTTVSLSEKPAGPGRRVPLNFFEASHIHSFGLREGKCGSFAPGRRCASWPKTPKPLKFAEPTAISADTYQQSACGPRTLYRPKHRQRQELPTPAPPLHHPPAPHEPHPPQPRPPARQRQRERQIIMHRAPLRTQPHPAAPLQLHVRQLLHQ